MSGYNTLTQSALDKAKINGGGTVEPKKKMPLR